VGLLAARDQARGIINTIQYNYIYDNGNYHENAP
jgi:hypothetical protein